MAEYRTVAKPDDIGEGELAAYEVDGAKVAIAKVGGTFFAFGDTCTHAHCSLAGGDLEDTAVICPCHGSRFDVRTGEVLNPPATEPIPVYRLRVQGEALEVEV